jgi:hypothetical protein
MNPVKVKELLIREDTDESLVFNLHTGILFTFDQTGIDVLLACDGRTSIAEIASKVDSSRDELHSFCTHLEQCGLIHFIDEDVTFSLVPLSHVSKEDELSTTYGIQFNYAMGDREFKQILIESGELVSQYLCGEKDGLLVGICELFTIDQLDEKKLFFYQPHFLRENAYSRYLHSFIDEIITTAKTLGKEKLEVLNVSDSKIQQILHARGFRESKKVVLWNLTTSNHSISSKLQKNIHYYERKIKKENITIRSITREDIPNLINLYRSLQEKKDIYNICFNNPRIFESLFELEGFDENICLLAEKGGTILGYHIWIQKSDKSVEWWISRIDRENSDASRCGIMDILFSRTLQHLKERGIMSAHLGWNDLADSGLCYYKWKWGGTPSPGYIFMETNI